MQIVSHFLSMIKNTWSFEGKIFFSAKLILSSFKWDIALLTSVNTFDKKKNKRKKGCCHLPLFYVYYFKLTREDFKKYAPGIFLLHFWWWLFARLCIQSALVVNWPIHPSGQVSWSFEHFSFLKYQQNYDILVHFVSFCRLQ